MAIPTSFAGIQFYTRSCLETGYNKQAVQHEIVKGNGPYIEIMGNGTSVYELEGFLDNSYGLYLDKNMFMQQIQSVGIGQLLHPSLGLVSCWCSNVTTREDANQLGIINITLTFVVCNNDQYTLTTDNGSILQSITNRASNYLTSMNISGLGTNAMSLVSGGEAIMRNVGGIDSALAPMGQTLGRFYQYGGQSTAILNMISVNQSTAGVVPSVISNHSSVVGALAAL
ncbi:DNA circularization N-terminal domain-containing protein [Novacetimonas hansenii]|uniref:DNA circulation N-terminal domain-containing protein n=1 Tax=Novacetimonas hansenii TaxID=436 RepID=A0ABQ0SIG7_NOVHA|nr:DNA circularization N-terminal domain-containing protein [Novacetimonas hansenii]GAN84015.1 hypothetical protein Gaha_0122_015 [Novacetimonas hansenii JCM 7643]GBQ55761.1 hypothetical protein AA0243_1003 [Novacetimonas hansenii NRIC 0243]GEC64595.1 hypothetical protein GHA01_24440 [Novacetimonas hansenii]